MCSVVVYVIFCGFMGHTMFGIYEAGYSTWDGAMWSCVDFFFNSYAMDDATVEHNLASGMYFYVVVNLGVLLILSQFIIGILCGSFDTVRSAMAEEVFYSLPAGFAPADDSEFVHYNAVITSMGGCWHWDTLQMFCFYPKCFGVDCRVMRHTLIHLSDDVQLGQDKLCVTKAEFVDALEAAAAAHSYAGVGKETIRKCADLMFRSHGAIIVDQEEARQKAPDEITGEDNDVHATAAQVKQLSQRMTAIEATLAEVLAAVRK